MKILEFSRSALEHHVHFKELTSTHGHIVTFRILAHEIHRTHVRNQHRFHDVTSVIDIASVVYPRKDLELIYLLGAVQHEITRHEHEVIEFVTLSGISSGTRFQHESSQT